LHGNSPGVSAYAKVKREREREKVLIDDRREKNALKILSGEHLSESASSDIDIRE